MTRREAKAASNRRAYARLAAAGICWGCKRRKRAQGHKECRSCRAQRHRVVTGRVVATKLARETFRDVDVTMPASPGLHEQIAKTATELATDRFGPRPTRMRGYDPTAWDLKRQTIQLRLYSYAGFAIEDQFGEVA